MFHHLYNILKNIYNYFMLHSHGNHVFGDFIWNNEIDNIDYITLAQSIFEIMEKSILRTNMKIVHKKLCILDTPPGFTSIILIDESHISSHCYSDKGWLAIDVFTCGNTNPQEVMEYIILNIKEIYPSLKCTYIKNHKRFHYIF